MKSKQVVKLTMYHAVIPWCEANAAQTAILPAFATTLTGLKAKVNAIDTTAQLEAQVTTGITINKADLKKALCTSAEGLAAAVYAFATAEDDTILQQKANYTLSDFTKLKDDELPIIVQNLHGAATFEIAGLAPYGITAATLDALQELIDEYSSTVAAPRNAAALRKTYVAQLVVLFKEADEFLKTQLDKLALQFKTTAPAFYETYKNNRKLVNAPTSATQVKGIITDSLTGLPIYLILITAQNHDYSTTSELDGSYSLKIPVPGVYTLLFTSEGYLTYTVDNVELMLGQATLLDAQLVPTP